MLPSYTIPIARINLPAAIVSPLCILFPKLPSNTLDSWDLSLSSHGYDGCVQQLYHPHRLLPHSIYFHRSAQWRILFRSFSKREWLCGESPQGVACISGRLSFCFSISLREISLANGLNSFGCKEKKRGETISSVKTKSSGSAYQTGR